MTTTHDITYPHCVTELTYLRFLKMAGADQQASKMEMILDREAIDKGHLMAQGGFARLNKVFRGKLEQSVGERDGELWRDAG